VKSKWLPTMPLHAANWLADPRIQMHDAAARCELLEALLRSWMLGRAIPVPAQIAEAYGELWPEYAEVRAEHQAIREMRAEIGKLGNEKRWGSQKRSQKGSQKRSQKRSQRDRTPTPTPTVSSSKIRRAQNGRRGTRLPDDVVLSDEWAEIARKHRVTNVEAVFREFVNYWTALPGQKATKLDWAKTWENQCIRVGGKSPPSPPSDPSRRNSRAPDEARQNVPSYEETRARFAAEDEERRRQELRAQVRRLEAV